MSEVIQKILFEDPYWKVNKALVKEIGVEPTVLLTDIIERYNHFLKTNQTIFRDGKHWFYYRSEDIKTTFDMGYKVQKRIIADLTARGMIETKLFQTPAKLHIHFIEEVVENILLASITKMVNLNLAKRQIKNLPNGETNKEYINNNTSSNEEDNNSAKTLFDVNQVSTKEKSSGKKENSFVLFYNSPEYDLQALITRLKTFPSLMALTNVDFEYYHAGADAWSRSKKKKSADWGATIRNFMLRDLNMKIKSFDDIVNNWADI
jgi:hypothetical protein